MDFYWAGFLFWTTIGTGLLLFLYGIIQKSWLTLIFSGIALFLPMLYFAGANNWFRLLAFVPLIPWTLAFFLKKSLK